MFTKITSKSAYLTNHAIMMFYATQITLFLFKLGYVKSNAIILYK